MYTCKNIGKVICPRCGKMLATEQTLYYHLVKKKHKCSELKCLTCNKQFNNKNEFDVHSAFCKKLMSQSKNVLCEVKKELHMIDGTDTVIENWIKIHKIKGRLCNFPNFEKVNSYIEVLRPINKPVYNSKNMNDLYKIIEYYMTNENNRNY